MSTIAGIGMLILDFFKTLVIDSIIKIILHPEECIIPKIKLGGPLLKNK